MFRLRGAMFRLRGAMRWSVKTRAAASFFMRIRFASSSSTDLFDMLLVVEDDSRDPMDASFGGVEVLNRSCPVISSDFDLPAEFT